MLISRRCLVFGSLFYLSSPRALWSCLARPHDELAMIAGLELPSASEEDADRLPGGPAHPAWREVYSLQAQAL